jgi:hypothetical protein
MLASMTYCFSGTVYVIRFGANRRDTDEFGALIGQSTESVIHEQYNSTTLNNDIALVKVSVANTGEWCS